MKIEICKPKIILEMVFISICILFGATVMLIPSLRGIPKLIMDYGIGFGVLFSSVWLVFCALWIGLLVTLAFAVKLLVKITRLSISIENNSILISHNNREWQIPKEDIKYVLGGNKGTMLVWEAGMGLKTFFLRKFYFTRKSYNEIMDFVSSLSEYQNDLKENTKTRSQLGLDHIFRKNKLENEL